MTDTGGLVCAYCGERHRRAAEVRACWERSAPAGVAERDQNMPMSDGPTRGSTPARTAGTAFVAAGPAPTLGRSVVVAPGAPTPPGWERCPRASGDVVELEEAWRERVPLVIEVDEDPAANEVERRPVWSLSPEFAFPGERRAHASFANAVDARGTPRFALADDAVRLGAGVGGPADVILPGGRPAFCDGGPFTWREECEGAAVISRIALAAGSLAPFGVNATAAPLAADQLAAVTHTGAAARIIAPAGSGKTRVLTERARHLLRHALLPGRALTLVAFNRRAAEEMRARTPDLPELQVRTLNALGLSLVGGAATTIEEREVRAILDRLVDLPRRANTDPAAAWIEALSAVRLGLQAPEEVEAAFGGDVDGLAEVFVRYRAVLAERKVVDFDEQVYGAIEILLTDPARRRAARARCGMLLVDEFQDLTPAHLLLIRLLAGPEGAVFGVGDDDQTIYGYTGASPVWLINYRRTFPTAGEHALEVNYRCPPAVVAAARTLLTHNRSRVDKTILSAPGRSPAPGELVVQNVEDALSATLGVVQSLLDSARPDEIAVLTRVNASLAPVQVALADAGVPTESAVDVSYLSRGGVAAALAWLRLALAPRARLDGRDIALALRRPARGASPRVVEWASEHGDLAGLERLARRLSGRDADKVRAFVADLSTVAAAASGTTADILRAVRDEVGLDRAMALLEGARRRLDRSAQTDDLDALVALGELHPEPDGFEAWLRAALARPGDAAGVALATIHRVKGREWPHVVLHDVTDGLVPHRLAEDVEEERRVFHVGLTRARATLHVVAGTPGSPFLAELSTAADPGAPASARPTRTLARDSRPAAAAKAAEVRAAVGLELEQGGQRGRVREVAGDDVLVAVGSASVRIRIGDMVTVAGRAVRLAPPLVSGATAERARDALRAWRSARATKEKKPPYVYLHDRTIEALVSSMPTTIADLARVPGIGPGKLDAYGEELLAVLSGARG